MKIILQIKLLPNQEQRQALMSTMLRFNTICNTISDVAFRNREFRKYNLQKLCYQDFRIKYPDFSSQLTLRAIDVVCQSYKIGQKNQTFIKETSAVVYDERCLTYKSDSIVSIWTTEGRINIPIQVWDKERFTFTKGQSDLVLKNGNFYLLSTCEIPDIETIKPESWLGVDLGIVKIATDSTGKQFSGSLIELKRQKYHNHRHQLQKRNTRNSRRRLHKVGKKESRFRSDVNHQIAKQLVQKAKGTCSGIGLEELTYIRDRVTVRKSQRAKHSGWAFAQLRQFITYKAALSGIPVQVIPAAYTSRTCSMCFHCSKENRKTQSQFCCITCGHSENADVNAAKNIARIAKNTFG